MVDVSRNVVAGLLVLVIAVSGVSTYYALWGDRGPAPQVSGPTGEVKLAIVPAGQEAPPDAFTTGNIAMHIERPEGT